MVGGPRLEGADEAALLNREELKRRVRVDLAGLDLVNELLAERRLEAANDDTI